jgi:hypothetical protein
MAEKLELTFQTAKKKQFLKAPQNWQKCSALVLVSKLVIAGGHNLPF